MVCEACGIGAGKNFLAQLDPFLAKDPVLSESDSFLMGVVLAKVWFLTYVLSDSKKNNLQCFHGH